MQTASEEVVRSALNWRYATKAFDPSRKIPPETWALLEESLRLSPSSFGLQPWKFLVVDSVSVREKLFGLSWNQRQVLDASHFVVFTVRTPIEATDVRKHIERTAEVQVITVETLAGFERVVNDFIATFPDNHRVREWAARQSYIALGTLMTCAAMLGVDTCPMEGLDPAGYDRELGLEGSGYVTVAACAVGYRASDDKQASRPKVRFPKEQVIQHI